MEAAPLYLLLFALFIAVVVLQRLLELRLAKRNEARLRALGAVEYGARHYPAIVALHALWIIGMVAEAGMGPREFPVFAPVTFALWLVLQGARYWVIRTLGPYWNTRVLVVPGGRLVREGPFRLIKHPNYLIVALELALAPLTFGLYWTAAIITVLNALVMAVRIPVEERALASLEAKP